MKLETIMYVIVSISAIIIALRNIYSFVTEPKKAYDNYQKKHKEETVEMIREVIKEEIKDLQCDNVERTEILRLILASQIERIYWLGQKDKTIYSYNMESLTVLYQSYKNLGGNGYITHLMEQMKTWELISNA